MSHYVKIRDALGCVKQLEKEIRVGPNGEGQDWINMLDAVAEDLEDVLDDLEPSDGGRSDAQAETHEIRGRNCG